MAAVSLRCLQTSTQLDDIASRIGEPRDIEDHESREVRARMGLHLATGAQGGVQILIRISLGSAYCRLSIMGSMLSALLSSACLLTLHCMEARGGLCFSLHGDSPCLAAGPVGRGRGEASSTGAHEP